MGPEILYASTDDGWRLALCRWEPMVTRGNARRYPVLMIHGMGANRLNLDLDSRHSIARAASARGFEVYVLELRGAGLSRAPHGRDRSLYQWGLDDHADRDLPAAVATVLSHSGAQQLHAVGHSMGGMLFYRWASKGAPELRSIVAIATPMVRDMKLGVPEKSFFSLASKVAPERLQRVPMRKLIGAATRFIPKSARLVDGFLLNTKNTRDEVLAKLTAQGIDDVPLQLVGEFAQQMAAPSPDSPWSYESDLGKIAVPVLAISGTQDRIAPAEAVRTAVDRIRSPDVRYREMGTRFGDSADYGHADLLIGRNAPEEVFPVVLDFIEEKD